MAGKPNQKRSLRYAKPEDMPEGMRKLYNAGNVAKTTGPVAGAVAVRGYRPALSSAQAAPVASTGTGTGKVARGRPRHVAGVMNKLEAAYDEHLQLLQREGRVVWYRFESVKLKLAKNTHLTVDFFVMNAAGELEAHEVKGYWEEDARVKVKVAAEMYPFRFLAIQRAGGGAWQTEVFN